jgi:hypothetical protein
MIGRLIMWVIFGFALSLVPLVVVAFLAWEPNGPKTLLTVLSNEELLAVALTLGGASAADVLSNAAGPFRNVKLIAGGTTLLATILAVAAYVAFKGSLTHLSEDAKALTDQYLYAGIVVGSFFSELLVEV